MRRSYDFKLPTTAFTPPLFDQWKKSTKSIKNQVEKKRVFTKKTNLAVRKRQRYWQDRRKKASLTEIGEAVATRSSGALSRSVIDAGDGDQTSTKAVKLPVMKLKQCSFQNHSL
ncbi:hypothetical protein OPV22_034004 [Ensete ventricosum]|uniref:Uncharacterized protein n=1 Tax=Ensete ventricosum TaxID=4639 RepID=A0AAV8PVT4_ENSVE|nr:hypothetical protein OPV22_034004 [Ensete ventricosum]